MEEEKKKFVPTKRTTSITVVRLLTIVLTLIWGAAWVFMKIGLEYMGPFTFSAFRFFAGAFTLFLLLIFLKRLSPKGISILRLIVLGILQTAAVYLLVTYGMVFVEAGKTSILLYTMPIWSTILASKFLHEKLTKTKLIAIALGTAGLLFIIGFDIRTISNRSIIFGELLVIIASVCWACANIYYQKYFRNADRLQVNAYQLLFGAAAVTLAAITMEWGAPIVWTGMSVLSVLFTGILASAISFSIWFFLLDAIDTATAAISVLLVPVFGLIFSAIFLGEVISLSTTIGSLLILAGVFVSQFAHLFSNFPRKKAEAPTKHV